jgi:hypothetical protein
MEFGIAFGMAKMPRYRQAPAEWTFANIDMRARSSSYSVHQLTGHVNLRLVLLHQEGTVVFFAVVQRDWSIKKHLCHWDPIDSRTGP